MQSRIDPTAPTPSSPGSFQPGRSSPPPREPDAPADALTLLACDGGKANDCTFYADADGDGYDSDADCNDLNPKAWDPDGAVLVYGDTVLDSPEALDGFCADACAVEVDGHLIISSPDINDLNNLSCLSVVSEELAVKYCESLTSLDGLTWVGDEVSINNNSALTSLAALSELARLSGFGEHLSIGSNPHLR